MTPLANRIVRELTLPPKRRTFADAGEILPMMHDVRCFEVTEVIPLMWELIESGSFDPNTDKMHSVTAISSFLPAPKTWVEWDDEGGARVGVLLTQKTEDLAQWRIAFGGPELFRSTPGVAALYLGERVAESKGLMVASTPMLDEMGSALVGETATRLHALLAIINTPKLIGRAEHEPNAMLAKRLDREKHTIGEYKLNGWSEIKLHVTDPEATGEGTAHMTGEKALHFCRSHLRIRLGRLERVRAHWRGNPELGVKQGRYTVTP